MPIKFTQWASFALDLTFPGTMEVWLLATNTAGTEMEVEKRKMFSDSELQVLMYEVQKH